VDTHRDRFVMGSRITMHSEISPNLAKYSRRPSEETKQSHSSTLLLQWGAINKRGKMLLGHSSGAVTVERLGARGGTLTGGCLPAQTADEHFPAEETEFRVLRTPCSA
jgi:hypothetical protein